jgi:tetrahydromethanopterin S-methyltransferase subunit G
VKYIEVSIREKDKRKKNLTLVNMRDELVNFMYRDTVASSSRIDQQFYVLLYFASMKVNEESLIESLLDAALPRFQKLSEDLSARKAYLKKHEYNESVKKHGLEDFFAYDTFFIICEAIMDIDNIEKRYKDLYQTNEHMTAVMATLKQKYQQNIAKYYSLFNASRIKDERTDDYGFVHDLSKSVYRTIKMRNAKNFELNLQKYTRIKKVTSNSPIILDIIQIVDPQIIFDLWDKYHVFDYMTGVWKFINGSPVLSGAAGAIIAQPVIEKYNAWKGARQGKDKKYKETTREAFKVAKSQHSDQLDGINLKLVQSVMDANKHLLEEVSFLKTTLEREQQKTVTKDDDEIKRLKKRIDQLENVEVTTSEVKSDDTIDMAEQQAVTG